METKKTKRGKEEKDKGKKRLVAVLAGRLRGRGKECIHRREKAGREGRVGTGIVRV